MLFLIYRQSQGIMIRTLSLFCVLLVLVHGQESIKEKDITTPQAWIYAVVSSVGLIIMGGISAALIIAVQQCISVKSFKTLVNILYALGCGAMIGDVMVHTLPQAFSSEQASFQIVALLFISAIVIFILVERAFMECGVNKSNWEFHKGHLHKKQGLNQGVQVDNHSELQEQSKSETERPINPQQDESLTLNDHFQSFHISYKNMRQMLQKQRMQSQVITTKNKRQLLSNPVHHQAIVGKPRKRARPVPNNSLQTLNQAGDTCQINLVTNQEFGRSGSSPLQPAPQQPEPAPETNHELNNRRNIPVTRGDGLLPPGASDAPANVGLEEEDPNGNCFTRLKGKGTAGYLNIITSFVHCIFDGFAIGAGFATRQSSNFISIMIGVYAHELPRQMGDVGIMMKNRFSGSQTIFFSAITNVTTLLGAIVAVAIGQIDDAFRIYVLSFAAGNFIYIAADIWRHLFKNKNCGGNVLQFISFALGVGIQYLLLLATSHED